MGDRVVHKAREMRSPEDFGAERYDFILVSQFVHHFDGATNRGLLSSGWRGRSASGGVLALVELVKPAALQRGRGQTLAAF